MKIWKWWIISISGAYDHNYKKEFSFSVQNLYVLSYKRMEVIVTITFLSDKFTNHAFMNCPIYLWKCCKHCFLFVICWNWRAQLHEKTNRHLEWHSIPELKYPKKTSYQKSSKRVKIIFSKHLWRTPLGKCMLRSIFT